MLAIIVSWICVLSLARGISVNIPQNRSFEKPTIPIGKRDTKAKTSVIAGCEGFACLERYVQLPDETFSWYDTGLRLKGIAPDTRMGVTLHVLSMQSQTWLNGTTSKPHWKHNVVLVEPANLVNDGIKSNWTHLVVGDTLITPLQLLAVMPDKDMKVAMSFATRLGTFAAVVYDVPNELGNFKDDPLHQAIVLQEGEKAYTWMHVITDPGRPEFMIELPNAKAVVRAMDIVEHYTSNTLHGRMHNFSLTGFSKRGMAAWMTAAVDKRVKAVLPGAMPLRLRQMIKNMVRSYGHPPIATLPYFARQLFGKLDTPNAIYLFKTIDAFNYLEKLNIPKHIMMTGNDEFMLLDTTREWLTKLPGENSFIMKPNLPHITQMSPADFTPGAAAFLQGVITGQPMPKIAWSIGETNGTITATVLSHHEPVAVRLWSARTCRAHGHRRDFRMHTNDPPLTCLQCGMPTILGCWNQATTWQSQPLFPDSPDDRTWVANKDIPTDESYVAFYIEFIFDGPPGAPLLERSPLSTEVSILPTGYPHKECHGEECMGDHITMA